MAALTGNRNTSRREDLRQVYPLADNVIVYLGSIVCLDANGNANPGKTATGLKCVGVALRAYTPNGPDIIGKAADNTQPGHAAGAVLVEVERTAAAFDNSATDPVGAPNIGTPCFVVDDHTVSATDGSSSQSVAGRVVSIDSDGSVWVDFNYQSALAT
ncbi:MAG: hypothetical protein WA005_06855 [Candidatus Binataceae bacterium]